jgi:hypothetical protein
LGDCIYKAVSTTFICATDYCDLLYCNNERHVASDSGPCTPPGESPILVDVLGDGYSLTDWAGGVDFDIDADGRADSVAWTDARSDDSFLALDRNGNGRIDDGTELFGTHTPQPASFAPNGFKGLAVFDDNHDGAITSADAVFERLLLWRDENHDGVSQPRELYSVARLGVRSISLAYRVSARRDRYGNLFRYRGDVEGLQRGRPSAYDVFLRRS